MTHYSIHDIAGAIIMLRGKTNYLIMLSLQHLVEDDIIESANSKGKQGGGNPIQHLLADTDMRRDSP